jgi:hypothetical protein
MHISAGGRGYMQSGGGLHNVREAEANGPR